MICFLRGHQCTDNRCRWVWKKWNGPKQLEDKKTGTLMMLPYVESLIRHNVPSVDPWRTSTDWTMVSDKAFKKYALEYAKSQDVFFRE